MNDTFDKKGFVENPEKKFEAVTLNIDEINGLKAEVEYSNKIWK